MANTELELAFNRIGWPLTLPNHALVRDLPCQTQLLRTTYYDTPAQTLAHAHWSLSIRAQGDQFIQRIKGPANGLVRPEFEHPVDSQTVDLAHLATTPLGRLLAGHTDKLKSRFTTLVERTTYKVPIAAHHIEVAIDEGSIFADDDWEYPIADIELEAKGASSAEVYHLALQLAFDVPMIIEPESKAVRGYALINQTAPTISKPQAIELPKNATAAECLHRILNNALDHLWQNLKPALNGNIDGVHQVRVAIRRIRAALRLFRPLLDRLTVQTFDHRLAEYARLLGAERDWDVFVSQILKQAGQAHPEQQGWFAMLGEVAEEYRKNAHGDVFTAMRHSNWTTLLLGLRAWVDEPLPDRKLAHRFEPLVPELMAKLYRKSFRLDSPEQLHATRKAVKKLRYSMEFIESLYPGRAVRKFIKPYRAMQEALGAINDASVAHHRLHELAAHRPALAPAIGLIASWVDQRQATALAELPKLIRKLPSKPFWR